MKKLIVIGGIIIALIALGFVGLRLYTKQFSPQETATYSNDKLDISVKYSRPYKNNRQIFGELVPYGETWRTGANEATVFKSSQPIKIKGKLLPAGKYSIFTIPEDDSWKVIFNKETGQWGVSPLTGKANHSEENNALTVEVNTLKTPHVFEQFTISFDQMDEDIDMIMMWDQTMAVIPIQEAN